MAKKAKIAEIELPWFPKEITAHNTGAWRGKAAAVQSARDVARAVAKQAVREGSGFFEHDSPVWVEYVFCVETMRFDEANLIQCCKPYIDGVVDAGMIPGDTLAKLRTWGGVFQRVPKAANRKVVLRFAGAEFAFRDDLIDHVRKRLDLERIEGGK